MQPDTEKPLKIKDFSPYFVITLCNTPKMSVKVLRLCQLCYLIPICNTPRGFFVIFCYFCSFL